MTADPYYADTVAEEASLNASVAQTLLERTALHAWHEHPRLNSDFEEENKREFDIGKAFHTQMTGIGDPIHVVRALNSKGELVENYSTKAAKEERDEAYDAGKTPLLYSQWEQVCDMVEAARYQLQRHEVGDVFAMDGDSEMDMVWQQDGVWNRARADRRTPEHRAIYDLKTTTDATPDKWLRRAMDMGVDMRAVHYLDGARKLWGGEWVYRFILVETKLPHGLTVVELSEAGLTIGRKKIRRARELFRLCLDTGSWPGYSTMIAVVDPPPWHATNWLERESVEHDYRQRTGQDILKAAMQWQAPEAPRALVETVG